jgi:glycosyltransferase involved in cell wall biosynthesis
VTFTSFIEGEELPVALASCDVKVFPSTTDTWGNAPLEAQASGLPVIVSEVGGPQELMVDNETGIRVCGFKKESLLSAMQSLMDETLRHRMGKAARVFTEINRIDQPFTSVFDSEMYRRRIVEAQRANNGFGQDVPLMNQLLDLSQLPTDNLQEGMVRLL